MHRFSPERSNFSKIKAIVICYLYLAIPSFKRVCVHLQESLASTPFRVKAVCVKMAVPRGNFPDSHLFSVSADWPARRVCQGTSSVRFSLSQPTQPPESRKRGQREATHFMGMILSRI